MTRPDNIKKTNLQEDALNTAQVEFTLDPLFLSPQKQYFLQAQDSIRAELEKFSSAWFQRRQAATEEMIAASKHILTEGRADPASAFKQIADWHKNSMERLAEDAKECTELMSNCAKALAQNTAAPGFAGGDEKTAK